MATAMKTISRTLALIAVLALAAPALATVQPDVAIHVSSVVALNALHVNVPQENIYLDGYATPGDGGGGMLAFNHTPTFNNGSCFQTADAKAYCRTDPKWDVAEWGIFGDHTTDYTTQLQAEFTAAAAAGVSTVTIKNEGQYLLSGNFTIPAKMQLVCGNARTDQPVNGSNVVTGDHKSFPFAILHPASATFTVSAGGPSGGLSGCVVENKAVFDTPNPTTLQSIYNITGNGTNAGAFGGTGITCGGNGCKIDNTQILGFSTGIFSTNKDTVQIRDTTIDATNCANLLHSNLLVINVENVQCVGTLTSGLNNGLLHMSIDTIAASGTTPANYRYHLATPCDPATGNCPLTGNIVWVGLDVGGAQPVGGESSAGRCTVKIIDNSNFECTNSQATATTTTGTTIQNSTKICGIANLQFVRALQAVAGTGIPGGNTVVTVAPRMGCVWIATAATASATISNLVFTDNNYNPSGALNCGTASCFALRPYTNHRFGTGMVLDDVHNGNFNDFIIFSHDIALQLIDGTVDNTLTGCHIEDQQIDLDAADIGIDIEDSASNIINCNAIHYGANQATGVLNNQTGTNPAAPNILMTGVIGSNYFSDEALDDEAGNLNYIGSTGLGGPGDIFVSDNIRNLLICNSFSGGETVRYNSSTAESKTQGCANNVFASGTVAQHGTSSNNITAFTGGGQANATHVSTDFVRVNAVASPRDSIMLRHAVAGTCQTVVDSAANAMQVYGDVVTADTINGFASSVGVAQFPGTMVRYCSTANGQWYGTIVPPNTPYTLAETGASATVPANTTEDTLATVTIPANAMGANGCLVVYTGWSSTASANAKTPRVRFGGVAFMVSINVSTSTISSSRQLQICNRNATNAQVSIDAGTFGNTADAAVTGTVDTTADQTLLITGQKATGSESLVLEQYSVVLQPHA